MRYVVFDKLEDGYVKYSSRQAHIRSYSEGKRNYFQDLQEARVFRSLSGIKTSLGRRDKVSGKKIIDTDRYEVREAFLNLM